MIILRALLAKLILVDNGGLLADLQVKPTLVEDDKTKNFLFNGNVHTTPYVMHPRGNNMY
ncbi:hypothetical protein EPI10_021005 [Gossypium australe]|uniref:Uncharacterized protein n=1 Tax=Gossypium australe TaxID=47621 RepID=A0A5B6WHM9_9ROSI|nr:hypothetical protein EPI10_021005 [Gossypium australe]